MRENQFLPNEIENAVEYTEAKQRVSEFKKFCDSCSLEEKRGLFVEFDGRLGMKFASVFLGIKPATSEYSYLASKIARENSRFENVNTIFFDKIRARQVMDDNPEFFDDFNHQTADSQKKIASGYTFPKPLGEIYFSGYMAKLKDWQSPKNKNEIIKAGLLFGIPKDIVLAYADNDKNRMNKSYNSYGFEFNYDENDSTQKNAVEIFDRKIKDLFQSSGMMDLIISEQEKLKG